MTNIFNLLDRSDYINVRSRGAAGDGVADDLGELQAAVDAAPATGGIIFFPPGRYKTTGTLILRAGIHLVGSGADSTSIEAYHTTADAISAGANPDWVKITGLSIDNKSPGASGWAINMGTPSIRELVLRDIEIADFLKGIFLAASIGGILDNVKINCQGKEVAGGVGLEVSAGNGIVCTELFVNTVLVGIKSNGQSLVYINPVMESCGTGFLNAAGSPTIINPWTSNTNTLDFDIRAGMSIFGYGSNNYSVSFLNATIEDRTIIIPNSNDNGPGIKLGQMLIGLDGKVSLVRAGNGLAIKEGSNATLGVATLVAGSIVVATTKVTATSRILISSQADGGTPGFLRVSARTAGVSFTVTSSNGADTSAIAWVLLEPA